MTTCGDPGTEVAEQVDWSINNAFHIYETDIPSCAVYLRIRIQTYAIPSGQSRRVYNSDLWDNESSW